MWKGQEAFADTMSILDYLQDSFNVTLYEDKKAFVRPCYKESDVVQWSKVAAVDGSCVTRLGEEEARSLYGERFQPILTSSSLTPVVAPSASPTEDSSTTPDKGVHDAVEPVLAVFVIHQAVVVDSPLYLKVRK